MNTAEDNFIPENLRFTVGQGVDIIITPNTYMTTYLADYNWRSTFMKTNALPNFIDFNQQTFSYYG